MRCEQCGFDYESVIPERFPAQLRSRVAEIDRQVAKADEESLRPRPSKDVWSVIEYACHVRDVLLIQRERTLLALVEDNPQFVPLYREERAANAHYDGETKSDVLEELRVAANMFAKVSERLTPEQLSRPCIYNFPEPTQRDIAWLLSHTMHEVVHHELDVRNVLEAVSSRRRLPGRESS